MAETPYVDAMRTRRSRIAAAIVAVLLLAGCSYTEGYGLRLNADGTVDYVMCSSRSYRVIEVDYEAEGEQGLEGNERTIEWRATGVDSSGHVVRYGEEPPGFERDVLEPPPRDWEQVIINEGIAGADREDLRDGEWVWWGTSTEPWVPEHPCDEADLEDLAR